MEQAEPQLKQVKCLTAMLTEERGLKRWEELLVVNSNYGWVNLGASQIVDELLIKDENFGDERSGRVEGEYQRKLIKEEYCLYKVSDFQERCKFESFEST